MGRACRGTGKGVKHIGYWWEIQKNGYQYYDQDVGGWIIFRWILERPEEGSCEHSNEPSGSIKCWETIEWLHN
jgi:hypothetical protein